MAILKNLVELSTYSLDLAVVARTDSKSIDDKSLECS